MSVAAANKAVVIEVSVRSDTFVESPAFKLVLEERADRLVLSLGHTSGQHLP